MESKSPSYTRREYHLLMDMSIDAKDGLIDHVGSIAPREKHIKSILCHRYPEVYTALICRFEEVPTLLGQEGAVGTICAWRLKLGK